MVDNEFHEREFTQQEFEQLLAPHFDEVRMFHQQDWLTSAVLGEEQLRQDDPEHPLRVHLAKVAGAEPTRSAVQRGRVRPLVGGRSRRPP